MAVQIPLEMARDMPPGSYCEVFGPSLARLCHDAGYSTETERQYWPRRWFEVRCASVVMALDDADTLSQREGDGS